MSIYHAFAAVSQTTAIKNATRHTTLFLSEAGPLSQRIYWLAFPYIQAIKGIYYCGQGSKELAYDSSHYQNVNCSNRAYRIPVNKIHGALYVGTGIGDSAEALRTFTRKSVTHCSSWLRHFGNTCFFFANFIELTAHISAFRKSVATDSLHSKKSAILGIMTSIGYMTALALALFQSTMTTAFIIAMASNLLYGLKIMHDFYHEYYQRL